MKNLTTILTILFLLLSGAAFSQDKPEKTKEPIKPALLVIDIQNAFLPHMDEQDVKRGMEMINYTIDLFRENGFPVIRVYHTSPGEGPDPGTEAFEFPKTVHIRDDDPRVVKNYSNSFKKTDLDKVLRAKGVNTVFLVGLSSVGCVLATYQGAADQDYGTFMVKDALISHDATLTRYVQEICRTIDYPALKLLLETSRAQ